MDRTGGQSNAPTDANNNNETQANTSLQSSTSMDPSMMHIFDMTNLELEETGKKHPFTFNIMRKMDMISKHNYQLEKENKETIVRCRILSTENHQISAQNSELKNFIEITKKKAAEMDRELKMCNNRLNEAQQDIVKINGDKTKLTKELKEAKIHIKWGGQTPARTLTQEAQTINDETDMQIDVAPNQTIGMMPRNGPEGPNAKSPLFLTPIGNAPASIVIDSDPNTKLMLTNLSSAVMELMTEKKLRKEAEDNRQGKYDVCDFIYLYLYYSSFNRRKPKW